MIGPYPHFIYDASGGGGEAILFDTNQKNLKYVAFCPKKFKIPPLSWKTTKILSLPLPPGIKIKMYMDKLEGTIDEDSGEIRFQFEAKFTLHIFYFLKFPHITVKSLLNTGNARTKYHECQGIPLTKNGKTKLVGVARISKTKNYFIDTILFLPTSALAELNCEVFLNSLRRT
tara:strand:- start:7 stop:525 length:519 start_codon:yes stop_codon:yes gene_type:complete